MSTMSNLVDSVLELYFEGVTKANIATTLAIPAEYVDLIVTEYAEDVAEDYATDVAG